MTGDPSKTARDWLRDSADLYAARRYPEAEAAAREALRLRPSWIAAFANLGAILRIQRRADEALAVFEQAIAIAPDDAALRLNHANLLNDLQRWTEALESAERACAAAPLDPAAHNARGLALAGLDRPGEAVAAYREGVRLAPGQPVIRFNLAKVLFALGETDEALGAYEALAAQAPGAAEVPAEQGHAYAMLGRWAEAAEAYDRAWALNPEIPYLAGQRLHARQRTCDWRDFDALAADLAARIEAGLPAATPLPTASLPVGRRQQLANAWTYSARTFSAAAPPPQPPPGERIRLGYFSADLHEHATAWLIAEMLELHDRAAFEVSLFSFGPDCDAPIRRRLREGVERFYEMRALGGGEIAAIARRLGLDIAVDLKGYTGDSRPEIFAARAAPVQVSFLGFPMTTGAPFMDYLIADRVLVGADETADYSEKIAWLPDCYQPNDRRRAISPIATTRADHGLPQGGFVFASFNGAFKVTPEVFGLWMELLREVPGSVLWLYRDGAAAARNLAAAAPRIRSTRRGWCLGRRCRCHGTWSGWATRTCSSTAGPTTPTPPPATPCGPACR